jgi:hypothetical protein
MGKASGAARRGGAAAAAAVALVLLGERAALAQDTTYFANHAGRSLGVPACVGNVADASCFRTDDPSPPDACIMRVRALFPAAPKQLFVPAPDINLYRTLSHRRAWRPSQYTNILRQSCSLVRSACGWS